LKILIAFKRPCAVGRHLYSK